MGKKKISDLTAAIRGEHLSLCVAAHLARTQLVADPRLRYDADHLMEMVESVAAALVRVAPVYVRDDPLAAPRELQPIELECAKASDGGNVLVLKNGKRYSSATIRRADLRAAIAILKVVGIPGMAAPSAPPAHAPAQTSSAAAPLAELETLLRPPLLDSQVQRANRLLVSLARRSPGGGWPISRCV